VAKRFDYLADHDLPVGTRVRVRLHGRPVGGWVTASGVEPPDGVAPRPLTAVSGYGPPEAVLALAEWAAWRWAMPMATLLRAGSPERNVRTLPTAPAPERYATPAPVAELRRLPPAADPLPAVLEALDAAGPGSVVVLVPNVGWAERLAARLTRRGLEVASSWAEAAAGWPVVVGSRTAAWSPVPRLGAGVVIDAHDEAYRHRYDAVQVLAERAGRESAPFLALSACPTAVQAAAWAPVAPPRPEEAAGWPAISIVDRRGADPRTGLLSEELVRLRARPLICVLNRTGRARLLACRACGELARCERCGRAVEEEGDTLSCRGCGAVRPVVCTNCGGTTLKVLRQGVSMVREQLEALLREPVGEVSGPKAEVPDTGVMVGTEAVLHRVRRAAAVVFLDFDQHLLAPRFAAGEQALALLARAGRLVGGRGAPGSGVVLVQTRLPDHDVLAAAVHGDPGRLDETAVRRELDLPPFSALAVASGEGAAAFARPLGGADLGDGRWLLRAGDHATLCDALAAAERPAEPVRITVDPTDV
jgi:primosomal protein N' (replication factor Y)